MEPYIHSILPFCLFDPQLATPNPKTPPSDNLPNLSTVPPEIHYHIFEHLPNVDLLNCLKALPSHRRAIVLELSRRCIQMPEHSDPLPLIRALQPYARQLHLDFNNDPSAEAANWQALWLHSLPAFVRLQTLELINYTACVTRQLGVTIRHLSIRNASITDAILVSYISPALRTLSVIDVDRLSGVFLRAMPPLQSLRMRNAVNSQIVFEPEYLVDYATAAGNSDALRQLHFESLRIDLYACGDALFPQLRNVQDLLVRDSSFYANCIYNTRTAVALATQLANVSNLNVQMTASALGTFFDAVRRNSLLKCLHIELPGCANGRRTQVLPQRLSPNGLSNLTTFCLRLPTPRWPPDDGTDGVVAIARCQLVRLVEQLAVLSALRRLEIISIVVRNEGGAPGALDVLPHDLTGSLLAKYLPRLQRLHVELPTMGLRELATMKELRALQVTVLRTFGASGTKVGLKNHVLWENRAVNLLIGDLCSLNGLETLSVFGSLVPLNAGTCKRFAVSRLRSLELSLGQKWPKLRYLLKHAASVRTFTDVVCDSDVWKQREWLANACPHVRNWQLRSRYEEWPI